MFRKIKSFFIGGFRKVKNGLNKFLGKKTMANYLLECEIVGGEIDFEKGCKVRVRPCYVYQKSEILLLKESYGIAHEKGTESLSRIKFGDGDESVSYIELTVDLSKSISKDNPDAVARPVLNASMTAALLSCNGMRVVLKLFTEESDSSRLLTPKDLTVVGFKAQF